MKYNHVFEIVWEYVYDDTEPHRTLIEVARPDTELAIRRFRKFFRTLHSNTSPKFNIVSTLWLGKAIAKCW